MTGDEVRDMYSKMKSANKIKVIINGIEIPYMSDYTFVDAKSFFKEPTRSALGVINNLNSYATFLTPRLKINFKFMPIETYRTLMKLIKDYNEFIVTVYDIVEDKYVTHKMYFYPKEFPQIYQFDLETLAVLDESFELVGTNASLETLTVMYDSNPPYTMREEEDKNGNIITYPVYVGPKVTSSGTANYNQEFVVGTYDAVNDNPDPTKFSYNGYVLKGWTEKVDTLPTTTKNPEYLNGTLITISSPKKLYALWRASTEFVLSFDYQGATANADIVNKQVTQNVKIGELPTPVKNGYTFHGWFTEPNGKGTEIIATSLYTFSVNTTIYAYWIGVKNNIIFDANGGVGEPMPTITNVENGTTYTLPTASKFLKENKVFSHWNTDPNDSKDGKVYQDEATITMGDSNLVLYAIYTQGYTLTFNTNGGTKDGDQYTNIAYLKNPIPTSKEGYYLVGWYADENFGNGIKFPITLKSDATIYARWEAIENV